MWNSYPIGNTMISLYFPLRPIPKGRPRMSFRNGIKGVYTPKETMQFEKDIRLLACSQYKGKPLQEAISVEILFFYQRPDRSLRAFPRLADIDNICKSVLDGLNRQIWEDDSWIQSLHAEKHWNCEGRSHEIMVYVQPMSEIEQRKVTHHTVITEILETHPSNRAESKPERGIKNPRWGID